MPRGDGTGPPGGGGRGRMDGTRRGAGPVGSCVCPKCGARLQHKRGTPCYDINCPECGAKMVRG